MKTLSGLFCGVAFTSILMMVFIFLSLRVEAAPLKFVPHAYISWMGKELPDQSNSTSQNIILNKPEIIALAMKAVNRFEDYRDFPDSLTSLTGNYPIQQLVKVFADAILAINNGDTSLSVTLNSSIAPALNFYINIEPDDNAYKNPLAKNEYLNLCSKIQQQLSGSVVLPDIFNFRSSILRSVEALYLLASVLRYFDFYEKLPEVVEIMITPKGLVPWDLSDTHRIYSSMNNGSPWYIATNNYYNVGKYETFKIAKTAIGNTTNSYVAGNILFDHITYRWITEGGYKIWVKPLGEPDYAYSNYRFNLSNSASQQDKINMLLRSVGLPCSGSQMWDDLSSKWINIDVHKPYGDEPYGQYGFDYKNPVEKNSPLINSIKEIITYNDSTIIPEKYIWINVADIWTYTPDTILKKCKAAGINNIILTIKSSTGYFYYPTDYNRTVTGSGVNMVRYTFDAVTPLTNLADSYGVKIYPAISVMNDFLMAVASWTEIGMDSVNNWMTYLVGDTNWAGCWNNMSISACVEAFKDSTSKYLKEIANLPGISGIVLGSLYMNTISYLTPLDGNPNCKCCNSDSGWQSNLLQTYASDLINTIKNENPNLKVIISSYPLMAEPSPSFEGMQNKDLMKNLADAYLVPFVFNQWLLPPDSLSYPPLSPVPYLPEDYISQLSRGAEKPIIVSFPMNDEWIYPPDFYTGLAKKMAQSGASSVCFHNFNSLDGEFGPAFDAFQFSTINALNFTSAPEIMVSVPNRKITWSPGTKHDITYVDNIPEKVKIELFKGGIYQSTIINSVTSWGSYSWRIPINQEIGDDYQIKISSTTNSNIFDFSNTNFSIRYPNITDGTTVSDRPFFEIFPNPTTGSFVLEVNEFDKYEQNRIEIYDIWGEKILTQSITGERMHEFSLSDSPVGVYFIRMISGDKTETVKIIKN